MNPCELTATITALANAIASKLSDNELALVAAATTQLGDTLATISVQRDLNSRCLSNCSQKWIEFVLMFSFLYSQHFSKGRPFRAAFSILLPLSTVLYREYAFRFLEFLFPAFWDPRNHADTINLILQKNDEIGKYTEKVRLASHYRHL